MIPRSELPRPLRVFADGLRRVEVALDRLPARVRPVPFVVMGAFALAAAFHDGESRPEKNRSAALAHALASEGLAAEERDVVWLTGPTGLAGALRHDGEALVRAHGAGEPNDLYLVHVRLSPEGVLLDVGGVYNLTRSSGVDESVPVRHGASLIAYASSVDGVVTGVHTMDVAGRSPDDLSDFTRVQRWQTGVTNLQQTGQRSGVVKNAFALDPPADVVDLKLEEAKDPKGAATVNLVALADGRRILIDARAGSVLDGASWVRASPYVRARPGNLVTWAVDRVRGISWFGEEKMQVVKAVAFTALDWLTQARTKVVGEKSSESAVAEELGTLPPSEKVIFTDPEIGWPPPPVMPILAPPIAGEGKWIPLEGDPFIATNPGVPSPFVTTFVRPDKQRQATRIYITLWDPRQVALHMEAGTIEPVSATGEAGPGVIPRAPEVMKRVVAGFNGGFQAMHGEFGMQASGVLYLPPKPYAATILEMRDGTTGFGSWGPGPDVPDDVLSFRQNMTALIENGKHNPWGRTWWGGTPKGWADNIHTTRSGVCLTDAGFVGYFWGHDASAEALAASMLAAKCTYSVHLDMNPGLAGFEFYDVRPEDQWKPLGRPLQADWEYEGAFRDMPGFKYRARRMIKGMMHMNFPQYIQRDARDFFYLTLRSVLPGAELASPAGPSQPGEGVWRVKGLPQHGFPYASATTFVRFDAAHPDRKARVLRLDPRAVRAAGADGQAPTVATLYGKHPHRGDPSLTLGKGFFGLGDTLGDASPLIAVMPLRSVTPSAVSTAVGVQDEDGMLAWIELAPETPRDKATVDALDALLTKLGCSARYAVPEGRVLLGGSQDLAGEPTSPPREGLVARLVRGEAPAAKKVFDTPIVSPNVWQPLQAQRVRYFKKASKAAPSPSATASDGATTPPPAPESPAPAGSGAPQKPAPTPRHGGDKPGAPPK